MSRVTLQSLSPGSLFKTFDNGRVFVRGDWSLFPYTDPIAHKEYCNPENLIVLSGGVLVIPVYEKPTAQPENTMTLESHRRTILGAINLLSKCQYEGAKNALSQLAELSAMGRLGSVSHDGLCYAISEIGNIYDRSLAIRRDKERVLGNVGRMEKALGDDIKKAEQKMNYRVKGLWRDGLTSAHTDFRTMDDAVKHFNNTIQASHVADDGYNRVMLLDLNSYGNPGDFQVLREYQVHK